MKVQALSQQLTQLRDFLMTWLPKPQQLANSCAQTLALFWVVFGSLRAASLRVSGHGERLHVENEVYCRGFRSQEAWLLFAGPTQEEP